MQESRLFQIIYHLLDKGHATAPELAEKFEVSVRTIYRDIDALSGSGIPIYTEPGRNGGIYLMKHFVLDKAVLSEREKQEILAALQSLQAATQTPDGSALRGKLSALFHVDSPDYLEVDFSRWDDRQQDNEKFEQLKAAVIHRRFAKITYAGSSQLTEERLIEPLKLMYKSRAWYLKAYCTTRQDYRIFKLTRILDLEILQDTFPRRPFPDSWTEPAQSDHQTDHPIPPPIKLRFPNAMAYRVYDEFDRSEITRQENGDLIVATRLPEDSWLMSFLLSFGTQVDVMEPAYLRELLAQQAKEIYEKNK